MVVVAVWCAVVRAFVVRARRACMFAECACVVEMWTKQFRWMRPSRFWRERQRSIVVL